MVENQKRMLCIVGMMSADGAETFLMKIMRNLEREKYQMDYCVTTFEEGYYDNEIKELGGKIYRVTPKTKGPIKNFFAIKDLVKREQYKYVMRVSQHSLSALELLAAKMGGAEVLVYRSSNSNTCGGKVNTLLHNLCKWMSSYIPNVKIAPSSEAAVFMFGKKQLQKGSVLLLPNALDVETYRFNESNRNDIRDSLHIEDRFVIGHVGRFTEQKNHFFLLDVFKKVCNMDKSAVLLLVGDGELKDRVIEYAKELNVYEKIIFTGVRSDVPELLSAMDAFLFPSLYEGMPNTVIEAQAAGLPCLIADTITREANITGLVEYFPLECSAEKWAKKILEFKDYEHKDTRKDFYKNHYDIESSVSAFVKSTFNKSCNRWEY